MTDKDWYNNKELRCIGAYKITNITEGKIYVGGTGVSFKKRWRNHLSELSNNRHPNPRLQAAFNRHGKDSFVFEILEITKDKAEIELCEQKWLDRLNPTDAIIGYNMCPSAKGALGLRRSAETRAKISKSNLGKTYTDEQKQRMSEGQKRLCARLGKSHWMFGRVVTDETRKKLSESHMGLHRGENSYTAKLTESDVFKIYQLLLEAAYTQKEIAQMFGVSRETISGIKCGRLWGWFTSAIKNRGVASI